MYLNNCFAQTAPGTWTDHISYHQAEKVAVDDNNQKVYVCTSNSLFCYNKKNGTTRGITKVQGLADVEIATIAFAPSEDVLIIAYVNSGIDILQNNNKITPLPYIKDKLTIPDRRINDILVIDKYAYLSCNFGIVVLDLTNLEIKDTYYPGNGESVNRVNQLCTDGKNIYAATQTGIYEALINDPYLVDYNRWEHLTGFSAINTECKNVAYLAGKLFAVYGTNYSLMYFDGFNWQSNPHFGNGSLINSINVSGNKLFASTSWGVFTLDEKLNFNATLIGENPTFATIDDEGTTWISDQEKTLFKITQNGNSSTTDTIQPPDSPFFPDAYKIDVYNGRVWTVSGSKTEDWDHIYNSRGAEYFNGKWNWYNSAVTKAFTSDSVCDLINVRICPTNPDIVYLASWTYGSLIQYKNNNGVSVFTVYNSSNSSLQRWNAYGNVFFYQINGLSFDASGNLWVTNGFVKNPLSVLTPSGNWKSFSLSKSLGYNPNSTNLSNLYMGDVLATSWGHKWIILGTSTNLVVYDSGNTPLDASDDRQVEISVSNVPSIIPPTQIFCIAEDHQGSIWVGTDAGPVMFSSPQNAFPQDGGTTGQKITVPIVKGQSTAAYLLETERINSIAIDGADRKWFGTQNSGAYLLSEDGLTQISHFTADNSPLFSNTINDIKIDPKSGEVYFATNKGLISYKGFATTGGDNFGKVYVYPNPIRENYTSNIFITGLIENTDVKITDISGNLVFETISLGGQAVWNGKNLLGKRVNTGVYLVFCSNKDGSKTTVTKLLFIH